ncbi:MAG TPA: sigma-70 family RNA polymerase sigma factor [Kribbella sp.]
MPRDQVAGSAGFDAFFALGFAPLVAFLQKAGIEREEAKDAAAEAMACAFQNWGGIAHPKAWVRAAAWRIATRQVQRQRDGLARAMVGDWTVAAHEDDSQLRARDEYRWVLTVLSCLPAQQRLVMAWHLDGFDTSEIADCLGISAASVRSHLRFARQRLKQEVMPRQSPTVVNE